MELVAALDSDGLPLKRSSLLYGSQAAPGMGPVVTGTTIVGLKFRNGIVFGADSRTSSGPYVANRGARKITRLADNIFLCRSGSAADTQALASICRFQLEQYASEMNPLQTTAPLRAPVQAAARLLQRLCYDYKDQLTAGLIVGGIDDCGSLVDGAGLEAEKDAKAEEPRKGWPRLFALPLGGALVEVEYTAGGSGSAFITAFLDDNYRPAMEKDEAVDLVQRAVSFAISRDGASGGMVRVVVLDADGTVEESHILGNKLPVAP